MQSYKELRDEPIIAGVVEPSAPPAYTPQPQPAVVYVVQTVERRPGWQHGIFECFRSFPNCLSSFCFPCWRQSLSAGRAGVISCKGLFTFLLCLWLMGMVNETVFKRATRADIETMFRSCSQLHHLEGHETFPPAVSSMFTDNPTVCQEAAYRVFQCFLPYLAAAAFLVFTKIFLSCVVRGRIRVKYGIDGSACEDMLCHTFCHTCATAQEGYTVDMLELGHVDAFACSASPSAVPMATTVTQVQRGEMVQLPPPYSA
jgi:Cys-rich protein (TIGR01571 family)